MEKRHEGFTGEGGEKYQKEDIYDSEKLQHYDQLLGDNINAELDFLDSMNADTEPGEGANSERLKRTFKSLSETRRDVNHFVHIKGGEDGGVLPDNKNEENSVLWKEGVAEFEKRDLSKEIINGLKDLKNNEEIDFKNEDDLRLAVSSLKIFDDIKNYYDNSEEVVSTQNPYLGVTSYKTWVEVPGIKLSGQDILVSVQVSFGKHHDSIFFRDLKVE
jgi:hypothetical protein